ncbi:UDP-glucosyltransferase 2-like isoform X2 [Adelges cooleyi]|nr:UDP-glucosyltransferase 2-like isoform X2 [Adelges cooleyi]XP_050425160.1 UDP-glucosyltransferase 2-like isoform X2 [Adelges cooleyi]XP_050425169.1 UDP-glucosyltransferase 2-like isoform X2 [Adelges cooleyi]
MVNRVVVNSDLYMNILSHPPIVDLLLSKRKFDLVITEMLTTTSLFAPIATILNAPIIAVCPMFSFPWIHQIIGEPPNWSYMSNILMPISENAPLVQRTGSIVKNLIFYGIFNWLFNPKVQFSAEKHYGLKVSSLMDAMNNISLVLVNSHHSIHKALPLAPGMVEIGGIHVLDAKSLPEDLKEFLDNSEFGVIIFSLGSIVSEATVGQDKLNNIFTAFSKLKQRVLMKFDVNSNITAPSNVKLVKWLPQRDLLAHPKVLVFISHGGLMSVYEAIHCGKPVVGIPIFGDQPTNVLHLVEKKVGVLVEYEKLNSQNLYNAIQSALSIEMSNNMKELQQLYFDRPQTPLQTAIYWTEYIIKNHDKPTLLKTEQIYLNWYETYLFDVIAAIVIPLFLLLYITKFSLRKCYM